VVPVEMPPPPGRSTGYPLQIAFDTTLYAATLAAMLALSTLSAALVAGRTVRKPIVDALAHT
jgi:putative ABC transport system permease protein